MDARARRAREAPGGHGDPLAVRNQPALWTARRRRWLIPAGLLAAVSIGMLAWMLTLQILIPWAGIILEAALYLVMVGCAIGIRDAHRRNVALAWLMGGLALIPTLALLLIAVGEWRAG